MRRWRFFVVVLLSSLAIWTLFPEGKLALRIDRTPSALGQVAAKDPIDYLIVAGYRQKAGNRKALQAAGELQADLKLIPGVSSVKSVLNVSLPRSRNGDVNVTTLERRLRRLSDDKDIDQLIRETYADPLISGRLVSGDGQTIAILLTLRGEDAVRGAAARQVMSRVSSQVSSPVDWRVTGKLILTETTADLMLESLSVLLPTIVGSFLIVVMVGFRSLRAALAVLVATGFALAMTLSVVVGLDWALNAITIIVLPLVMMLCLSFCMHILSATSDTGSLRRGLKIIAGPLVFSALTTAVGLAALGLSPLSAIREFAVLGASGTSLAALASWLVIPLLVPALKRPPETGYWLKPFTTRIEKIVQYVVDNNRRVVAFGIALALFCVFGASRVMPGSDYVADLPASSQARIDFEQISQTFGGASQFTIDIKGAAAGAILDQKVLRAIENLQSWLESQPEIGGVVSGLNFFKRVHQSFGSGLEDDYRIPEDSVALQQYLFVGAPDDMYDYVDLSYSDMKLVVRTGLTDTLKLKQLLTRVEAKLSEMPAGLSVSLGGESVELRDMTERIAGGQLESLAIAAGVIYLLLSAIFASPRAGFMAMLPNLLPVVAYFAILGFLGIPLSPTTALVACIVLGIAVDDTLHLLVRFNQLAREIADEKQATRKAVSEILRPITLTTLSACLAFLSMTTSPFASQALFGVLAATTLALAWLSDLLLAPAVSAGFSVVTIWDHVQVDLGKSPQSTIPMMRDMSDRQARQFALNFRIDKVGTGSHLVRKDDTSTEMYVVIDGAFKIWVPDENGQERILVELGRGSTIGEVGLFAAVRSANATATCDSRVLALSQGALEKLRNRSPRLAALVYRNLNTIQAERRLKTA